MILTVASCKGGVCKTTTAAHLCAYLNTLAPALLLDADKIKNATGWSQRGDGFPFRVAPIQAAAKLTREFAHTVIDTGQGPTAEDLAEAADYSDLLVIPAVPAALDSDGLGQTIRELQKIQGAKFRVLLTMVAPDEAREAAELRELLAELGAPVFATEIPRLKAFKKAAANGGLVNTANDRNAERAWAAYVAAGKELGL